MFRYLALLAKQTAIESSFIKALPDHLNAEVSSGTVTTVDEARPKPGGGGKNIGGGKGGGGSTSPGFIFYFILFF